MPSFGYTVDQKSGEPTFHYNPDDMTADDYAMMRRIEDEQRRLRPLNRGDVEDLLAALGRIEALLQKPDDK